MERWKNEEFLGLNADVRAVHLPVDEKSSALLSHWCHSTALLGWQPSVVTAGLTERSAQISENKSQQTLLSPRAATAEHFIIGHVRGWAPSRAEEPHKNAFSECRRRIFTDLFRDFPKAINMLPLICGALVCCVRLSEQTAAQRSFWGWGRALSHPSQLHSTPQIHKAFHQGRSKGLSWGGRAVICLLPTGKLWGRGCLANSMAAFFNCSPESLLSAPHSLPASSQPPLGSAQTYSSLSAFWGCTQSRESEKKGGNVCKKTNKKKCSNCKWNLATPTVDTWGVMLCVNAVQPSPVKWSKLWLQKMVLDVLDYEECSVLMCVMNMPWW